MTPRARFSRQLGALEFAQEGELLYDMPIFDEPEGASADARPPSTKADARVSRVHHAAAPTPPKLHRDVKTPPRPYSNPTTRELNRNVSRDSAHSPGVTAYSPGVTAHSTVRAPANRAGSPPAESERASLLRQRTASKRVLPVPESLVAADSAKGDKFFAMCGELDRGHVLRCAAALDAHPI